MATFSISATARKAQATGTGAAGPFSFAFQVNAQSELAVYVDNTLKTLTTHYTVTLNADGTGSITFTSGNFPTTSQTVTILGNAPLSRTSVYTSGGNITATALETDFDTNVMVQQQQQELLDRSIIAPVSDPSTINMTLPNKTDRANQFLKFDANGNPGVQSSLEITGDIIGANYVADNFTGDGSDTTFTLSSEPGSKNNMQVYIDGVYQQKNSYSVSGTTLTFSEAPPNNTSIEVVIGTAIESSDSASAVNFTQPYSTASVRTVQSKLEDFVSVKDFGAVGDGVTDDTAAIQAALDASNKIFFPNGTYLISSVSKAADNIEINLGSAVIKNNGGSFVFDLGVTSDTPTYTGVKIYGGYFQQVDPTTTNNRNYIRIRGLKDFVIKDCRMDNVSNGGIYIEAGTENGLIDGVTIRGKTNYSTIRGIWLIGATASDYASNYMDTSSLTRNATAFPVYAVENIRITNCKISTGSYGIYNMNTRHCVFENNYIENFGGSRGLTINTYSPYAIVKNNTIVGSGTGSGILVTQASTGVVIDGNIFQGNFGGGRSIQVQYLADALITNNNFFSTGSQCIDINTAGTATIRGNYFKRAFGTNTRAIYALPVDRNIAGTGTIGDTATTVPGFVVENNIISGWGAGVALQTNTSNGGNVPGWDTVIIRGNVMYEMDNATTSSEYLLRPENTSTTQSFKVHYYDNTVFPVSAGLRNRPLVSGDVIFERRDYYAAAFQVAVASAGGAITVSRQYGALFELSVSRSGTDLVLTPRSPEGSTIGQSVPDVIGITPDSTDFVQFKLLKGSGTWTLTLVDAAGSNLDMTSDGATFVVHLASNVS